MVGGVRVRTGGVGLRVAILGMMMLVAACGAGEESDPTSTPVPRESSSSASAECQDAVNWDEAGDHVGDRVSVTGPVVDATYASTSRGRPTFINLGESYPSLGRFTIVIWGEDRNLFDENPEDLYTGESVCVTGRVTSFDGLPQIEVDSPSQITVLNGNTSQQSESVTSSDPTATPRPDPTSTREPGPTPTMTPELVVLIEFAPDSIEDLLPALDMFDGKYTLQSSNYMSHDRIDSLPGYVDGVGATFGFDIHSVSNPEKHMLSFGALCFEFETPADAEAGFDESIALMLDTPSFSVDEVEVDSLPIKHRAFEGATPVSGGGTENGAHVTIQADRFVCQYSGLGLRGYHKPLDDVLAVITQIISRT